MFTTSRRRTAIMADESPFSSHEPSWSNFDREGREREPVPTSPVSTPSSQFFDSNYSPSRKRSKSKKKGEANRAPRPPNAWILYRAQKNQEIVDRQREGEREGRGGARLQQSEVSRIISSMWQAEGKDTKERLAELARKHKDEHRMMYPDYQYRPRALPGSTTSGSTRRAASPSTEAGSEAQVRASRITGVDDPSSRRIPQALKPRHASRSSRELDNWSSTSRHSGTASPDSIPGSTKALDSIGIGVDESSFDGITRQTYETGAQRRSSRPRALTDVKPHQLSSPPLNSKGSPSSIQSSPSSRGGYLFKDHSFNDSELTRKGKGVGSQTRYPVRPSPFLPPSYQPPGIEPQFLSSPRAGQDSAFSGWPSDFYSQDSSLSTSAFRFQGPRSAPAESVAQSPFGMAMDSSLHQDPAFSFTFEKRTSTTSSHLERFNSSFQGLQSTDSIDSSLPISTPSLSSNCSFPQFGDFLYYSSRPMEEHEWDSVVDRAAEGLNLGGPRAPWNSGLPSRQSPQLGAEASQADGLSDVSSGWKGKGKAAEAHHSGPPGRDDDNSDHSIFQDQVQVSRDPSTWRFQPASAQRYSSISQSWDAPSTYAQASISHPAAPSSSSSLNRNAQFEFGFQEPLDQASEVPTSSQKFKETDGRETAPDPSSSLHLDLRGEDQIELHGSFTSSELLKKVLEMNKYSLDRVNKGGSH